MASIRLDESFASTKVDFVNDVSKARDQFDALIVVADKEIRDQRALNQYQSVNNAVKDFIQVDSNAEKNPSVLRLEGSDLGVNRLVFSPTGPLNRDYDDARRLEEAAFKGVKRALDAGSKAPLVYFDVDEKIRSNPLFENAELVSVLGALRAIYVPLEIREAKPEKAKKLDKITFHILDTNKSTSIQKLAHALEAGRIVARDIGGSDPERMAAPRVAEYVKQVFANDSSVKVEVQEDQDKLNRDFPLLGAVNRAASVIQRHHARVIILDYQGEGPVNETVLLVGKGITYDTGGADVKAGGVMAGMHRDKCGAAAVAGFFKTLSILKPPGIRVIGSMSMVRNSIGENCYVADEIITSRAGVRVRVGNTDAEGRMVMADLLCYMKERIVNEKLPNPQIYTIATLTGHAVIAVGPAYSAVCDNGPAVKQGTSRQLFDLGGKIAEPVELSSIRREDYDFVKGKSEYEDVLQCNNLPSVRTPRGHQLPAAFMIISSGLDKHGIDSENPIPYTHIDIAGSSGDYPGLPTGTPLLGLAAKHVIPRVL